MSSSSKSLNTPLLEWNQNSLPDDISLKIASFLQIEEVCKLGSCSRFWHELCSSDFIWMSLYTSRWPSLEFSEQPQMISQTDDTDYHFSSAKGWRSFYIVCHSEMAGRATAIIEFVNKCSTSKSLEVGSYLKAIENLCSMQLGFKDVEMFLFASKHDTLLNLVGLHYSIFWLGIPADYLMEALLSCHISERQVCVKWWKLGRWSRGFRLRDESHSRKVSLEDLALAKEEEVLEVLHRGAIHEVLRVQISVPCTAYTPWTLQNMYTQN